MCAEPRSSIFEQPLIRPPSEWRSTLIRVTRGCNWNRCRFCGLYPHLGEPIYSERSMQDIERDIEFLHQRRPNAEEFFLGDADPLNAGTDLIVSVLDSIRRKFPVRRITAYARFSTLKKIGPDLLATLAAHGLARVHLGLESGDSDTLRFQRKGQSPEMVKAVSAWLKAAGIEQSFYVLLGLGGVDHWHQHMLGTAEVINQTQPEFVRLRRLWIYDGNEMSGQPGCPLMQQVQDGTFIPQTPEGTVRELALLLDNLKPGPTFLTCDHANNFIQVHGVLDRDLGQMRDEVHRFLQLPDEMRQALYRSHGSSI